MTRAILVTVNIQRSVHWLLYLTPHNNTQNAVGQAHSHAELSQQHLSALA